MTDPPRHDPESIKAVALVGWGLSIVIGAYDVPTAQRKAVAILDRLVELGWRPPGQD